jgi:two-component system CheB/CheR fusion protein
VAAKKSVPNQPAATTPASPESPLIVAVGASAGGLEAFTELLTAMPRDLPAPGLALVCLQHLQPGHPSLLAQLLQRATAMVVEEAADGVRPLAHHVYVLPPGMRMRLQGGRLRLRPTAEAEDQQAIDEFMGSLAGERRHAAIGVVLSGTANDGTQGLQAIKAAGGISFAQSEGSAEFPGMVQSAIASGAVDYVLTPGEIGRELARMARHPDLPTAATPEAAAPSLTPAHGRTYAAILSLVQRDTGMDFSEYRSSTLRRRIARRMALLNLSHPEAYLRHLRGHPGEVGQLGEDMLIPATRFFRDARVFQALDRQVLQSLARQRRPADQPIRIWSVGCSTGEEAYSLAILALEALDAQADGGRVQVFGTDLNESSVRRARQGHYGADIAQQVSPGRLQRFFVKTERGFRVNRALRETCIFARHNAIREAPFSRMDVVVCRNLMIYMEPVLQTKLLQVLHYALRPEGTLVLGSAESTGAAPRLFKPLSRVDRKLKIFVKVGSSAPLHIPPPEPRTPPLRPPEAARPAAEGLQKEIDRLLLQQFAPPGVIVDANLDVVEFRGHTSPFLAPAPGAASLNLLKLARGDIGAYVRSAVLQARRGSAAVRVEGVRIQEGRGRDSGREIRLTVTPLQTQGAGGQALYLVLFQPPAGAEAHPGGKAGEARPASRREIERMRRTLDANRRLIATLSEEHQASRQEYQAANEEIASANEELQSTNEELETSKEELQSTNEELNTVNEELRYSNAEHRQLSEDLHNLVNVVESAIVMLDRDLRVRRFSPAAERRLHMIPGDIGRPMRDIHWGIPAADVEQLAHATLTSGEVQTREVQDAAGHWFELRLHPYWGTEKRIAGVVAIQVDVDAYKRLSLQQAAVGELLQNLIAAAAVPMALLNPGLGVLYANQGFRDWVGAAGPAGVWKAATIRRALDQAGPGAAAELTLAAARHRKKVSVRQVTGAYGEPLWLLAGVAPVPLN